MSVQSIDGLNAVLGVSGPIYVPRGLEAGPVGYVTTGRDSIVAARQGYIGQTIADNQDEGERGPRLDILLTADSPYDNRSYRTELMRQAKEVGVETKLWTPGNDEAALEIIEALSNEAYPGTDGMIALLPTKTVEGADAIRARINRRRDPDGLAPAGERRVVPATASAMAIGAACLVTPNPPRFSRNTSPDALTVRAYQKLAESVMGICCLGNMTTRPLVEDILTSDTIDAHIAVTLGREDFDNPRSFERLRECDVLFLAARRASYLKREYLKHGAVAIDVGNTYDEELGRNAGNLHESAWQAHGLDRLIPGLRPRTTAFDRCIGRISASIVIGRTTDHWLANRANRTRYVTAA